jgi:diadenosine tetraphosphate (Ap4A) HIT family hydrolase
MSDSKGIDCPFCHLEPERVLDENDLAIALADAFPVSQGHGLVVSRRHVADFFELSSAEVAALVELLFRMKGRLTAELDPGGFNIGVNVGTAAGQTFMHVHVHLIPRFPGDVTDPRGGVRNVIPGKGPYPYLESGCDRIRASWPKV